MLSTYTSELITHQIFTGLGQQLGGPPAPDTCPFLRALCRHQLGDLGGAQQGHVVQGAKLISPEWGSRRCMAGGRDGILVGSNTMRDENEVVTGEHDGKEVAPAGQHDGNEVPTRRHMEG